MRTIAGMLGLALVSMAPAGSAFAQSAPISRIVPVSFTGTVTSSAQDSIMVRQGDGTLAPYTGPLPAFPLLRGDQVTISFNAQLPTQAFVDDYLRTRGVPPSADGIYRIEVQPCYYSGCTTPVGAVSGIGGSLMPVQDPMGQPTNLRMTIVYDYNADSYSIDWASKPDGSYLGGQFGGAGYLYDPATGRYVPCANPTACQGSATADPVLFSLSASNSGSTISTSPIRINALGSSTDGVGLGFFSMLFDGSWNLPAYGANPNPVPEPGTLLLFGAAAALVPLRRRNRSAA